MPIIPMILLAIFLPSDVACSRVQRKSEGVLDVMDAHASQDGATSPAGVTEINLAGRVFSPAFHAAVRNLLGVDPNDPPHRLSKTLDYVKSAFGDDDRDRILKAACDSSSFTCGEIIQFADVYSRIDDPDADWLHPFMAWRWVEFAMLFTKGRSNKGCISDPANAKSILDSFARKWHDTEFPSYSQWHFQGLLDALKQAFVDNERLKPAQTVLPQPTPLQTGLRTDRDMERLLGSMAKLELIKNFKTEAWYEFKGWLQQIRANGEQLSGPQMVILTHAIPKNIRTPKAVSVLLQYLEQYVTGVTCEEVNQILERMATIHGERYFRAGLDALKSNIVDGQNKVAIVAATEVLGRYGSTDVAETERVLRDVGVGLPSKNNPIFGVVKGNPVILVVDESTSMDVNFTTGDDTVTCRKFCHRQLETVLQGLSYGTHFNVIRYSSSAVKVFRKPVLVSKTNIDTAMEVVSWRGGYTPGQDPVEMLRDIQVFALEYKHPFNRSNNKDAMEALRLAYATVDLPSQQIGDEQHIPRNRRALLLTKDIPQIYFLTSGQPDGGARQILDKIDEFDNGRNIPVNCISFTRPGDPEAKQFVKDLASKTGGFFRPIEQAS